MIHRVGDQQGIVLGGCHLRERVVPAIAGVVGGRQHDSAVLDAHLDLFAEAAFLDNGMQQALDSAETLQIGERVAIGSAWCTGWMGICHSLRNCDITGELI